MLTEDNMEHMAFIDGVAESDTNMLRYKETTYKASWKRAGGRSAWFMARRNMDRLINMMAPPARPDNGFNLQNVADTIDAIDTAVIVGDARLGVKFPGEKRATVSMLQYLRDSFTAEDVFAKIEQNPSGADGTVLASIRDLRRYLLLVEAEMVARNVVEIENVPTASAPAHAPAVGGKTKELDPNFAAVISEGEVHELNRPRRPATERDYDAAGSRTPEDGGQHSSLVPWQIDGKYAVSVRERVGDLVFSAFWKQVTSSMYRLEPVVMSRHIPKELAHVYKMSERGWLLRVAEAPEDLRDEFPRLQVEMNIFEFEMSNADYRHLYHLVQEKWRLRDEFLGDWGRES